MTIPATVFSYISDLVKQDTAIVLGPGKEYLVENRLLPLAREVGCSDVVALIARLNGGSDDRLRRQIVEAMTTNETSFFRDRDPFNALSQIVLPDLCRKRTVTHRLSIWSAACSSGQEPYSIAMSVLDHPLITSDWTVDVLATDINEEMIERAQRGRFSQLEVNRGLPVSMLVRHLERFETDWKVLPAVRNMVRFKKLNLDEAFDLPLMDVVFLRNVLIYFDATTKAEVLKRVRKVLRPDGYLFLGGSESPLGLDDSFERVALGNATAYRPRGAGVPDIPTATAPPVAGGGVSGPPRAPLGSAGWSLPAAPLAGASRLPPARAGSAQSVGYPVQNGTSAAAPGPPARPPTPSLPWPSGVFPPGGTGSINLE